MLSGLTILELNQIKFNAKKKEIENFAVEIANNHLDIPFIAKWLDNHTT